MGLVCTNRKSLHRLLVEAPCPVDCKLGDWRLGSCGVWNCEAAASTCWLVAGTGKPVQRRVELANGSAPGRRMRCRCLFQCDNYSFQIYTRTYKHEVQGSGRMSALVGFPARRSAHVGRCYQPESMTRLVFSFCEYSSFGCNDFYFEAKRLRPFASSRSLFMDQVSSWTNSIMKRPAWKPKHGVPSTRTS